MKNFPKFICRTLVAGALLLTSIGAHSAHAQAGASGMPDLSDFAGAIAKSAQTKPAETKTAPKAGEKFTSGLPVPRVKPGEGARDVGRQFREAGVKAGGPEEALKQLENAMPQFLAAIEGEIEKKGFKARDMGVIFGVALIDMYETATKAKPSEAAEAVATKSLALAVANVWGPKFKKMPPAQQEKMYESVIMATFLNTLLVQQFDEAGKTEEADAMRTASGELFEKLIGVPAAQMQIAADGRISGLAPDAK